MSPIRPATASDLGTIARLHESAFRGFFLTKLGRPFLCRYYEAVLSCPTGILLVAEEGGGIAGLVAGFGRPAMFYRSLRRRALRLGLAMLPRLARSPSLLVRAVADFRRTGDGDPSADVSVAELSSLAVDPAFAGKGVGSALVTEFLRAATSRGASSVRLTTDVHDNEAVNAFYRRLGFMVRRTFEATPGRLLNEFEIELGPSRTECARRF